ncbi:MAG: hypothetical protein AB7N54_06230 [Alphaproteobacteria bacterium]
MPLTPLQREVARVLAPFRDAHDFVGGGAVLNVDWPRLSDDTDIFRDTRGGLPHGIDREIAALEAAGFAVETTTRSDWMVEIVLRRYGFETKVQWLDEPETTRRFFPAVADDAFGFCLHPADLAVNKVLCAARRRSAPRDAVDLVHIVQRYVPLGPLVWAVAGKDGQVAPPETLRRIRAIAFGYADEEIRAVRLEGGQSTTRDEVRAVLADALDSAAAYCEDTAPVDFIGHLFVDADDRPVAAGEDDIAAGRARALPIHDFTPAPSLGPPHFATEMP